MNLSGMPQADLQSVNVIIEASGYYPALSTAHFIEHYAVAQEYASKSDLLVEKLTRAQADINQELASAVLINGELLNAQQIIFYSDAVYSKAKANLLVSKLGSTHRESATAQSQTAIDNYEYWKGQSINAMRQLQGLSPNLTVELL
ncbi:MULTISPECIES: head completion/stabilization protein [Pseudoalteromonas]|uniref:head completion/stabilization protein n=1 Tax=Pseudoalteromonas TaxID=53246 RepID=UPI0002C9B0B4|nr:MULTISPECIES: head completion/stabilization protein [Pseudoalteromonas]ENN96904.1 phage head completeion protein [Pseudoalteromonas agarivorans S816]TMS64242.1 phage head protein [Pseudoalteromonas sp. S1691]TMS68497.1 phage head protein [Pseudoalteromonas sp. S1731]TMS69915.1 phage head protein [Pseudoalteromonas sp. S1941]TMS76793.1 phage head protein [Pseudoalteromonas sp. S1690]